MVSWKRPMAILVGLTIALFDVGAVAAQTKPDCSDEKSHQFDFWIGEWEVYSDEQLAGHNSIEPIVDGCVLQETWQGSSGSAGTSFNFYNPRTNQWQQFWVWRNGTTLELAGEFADGLMILEGDSLDQEGQTVRNRITWYDNSDGTVRQHWETSQDAGKTWSPYFFFTRASTEESGLKITLLGL